MPELELLKRRMSTARDLRNVVKMMKGLAAVSIRRYEQAAASLRRYELTIENGLSVVLRDMPGPAIAPWRGGEGARLGVLVFGSDQGMCGRFNEQVLEYCLSEIDDSDVKPGFCSFAIVGARLSSRFEGAGLAVERALALPGSLSQVSGVVHELIELVRHWTNKLGIDRVWLFFNVHRQGSAFSATRIELLPLDATWINRIRSREWPGKVIPSYSIDKGRLFSALVREYFFVSLYRGLVESMASENAARLAAMQAAEKNIEERIDTLLNAYNRQRQAGITGELLDIVGGFTALS